MRLSDAQHGVLSRLVEGYPVQHELDELVAQTEADVQKLRLRPGRGHARSAAEALVKRGLARRAGKDKWVATAKGRDLIAGL